MSPEVLQELRSFFVSILVDAAKEVLPALAHASETASRDPVANASRPRELLRPRQAAELLNISEQSLWSLSNAGQVPFVRIGRLVRYDPVTLDRWINDAGLPRTGAGRVSSRAAVNDMSLGTIAPPELGSDVIQAVVRRPANRIAKGW
jgi:excisionase family DNA binding protein